MSRYTFPGNKPELVIVAGWDNPLETYPRLAKGGAS